MTIPPTSSVFLTLGRVSVLALTVVLLSACNHLKTGGKPPLTADASSNTATASVPAESYEWVQPERIKRHMYAAIGVGASRMEPDASESATFTVNDRVDQGSQIALGMDMSRQWSLQLHANDLGSAGFSPTGRINYQTVGASALIYAGKNRHRWKRQGLSAYGRVGLGWLLNSTEGGVNYTQDNSMHLLVGAGLEYMTRIGLGVRLEGVSYEEDARYAQLGLIYRTGRKEKRQRERLVEAPIVEPTPVIHAPVSPAVAIAKLPPAVSECEKFNGTLDGVNFHSGSAKLTDQAQAVLDDVASALSECRDVPVSISAHTDSQGSADYNQRLSAQRAASVASYLRGRGIESDRLSAQAFGETQPIDSNSTKEGRSRNRRVELVAQ